MTIEWDHTEPSSMGATDLISVPVGSVGRPLPWVRLAIGAAIIGLMIGAGLGGPRADVGPGPMIVALPSAPVVAAPVGAGTAIGDGPTGGLP
ncbi:MAG TPA: hypothetical protein VFJ80_13580 [Candidatus Limnocylindrales bacterium]|jgi:hypothetical protein|nr:hypothetical protein [Candidatus Limnocylindrales bacterium]